MSEADDMRLSMVALARAGTVSFRNNVAQGVMGAITWFKKLERITVGPGDVVVRNARVLHAGLITGSSDLIGWHSVVVTQEMVGQRIAVFTAVEQKRGRRTPEQENFVDQVQKAGGIAGFAYSPEEAVALVKARFARD